MQTLEQFLVVLAEAVMASAEHATLRVSVTDADLTVPIETHANRHGDLCASMPRSRLITGFAPVTSRLHAVFVRDDHDQVAP